MGSQAALIIFDPAFLAKANVQDQTRRTQIHVLSCPCIIRVVMLKWTNPFWLEVLFPFLAHLPLFTFFANNPFFKCPKSPHTTSRTIPLIDWKYLPDCWISVSSRHCWRWRRDANVLVHHLCLLQGLSSKGDHPGLSPASRRWTSMPYLLPP